MQESKSESTEASLPLKTEQSLPEEESSIIKQGFFAETGGNQCSVLVALRVRPLIQREIVQNSRVCVKAHSSLNELVLGNDRCFKFDKVFPINTPQNNVFESCVQNLVLGCFEGYNATVLAYGQTGSGKTYTMGSGQTAQIANPSELGIIPRVIHLVFSEVSKRSQKAEFIIKASFLEIYNQEIHDLLDPSEEDPIKRYSEGGNNKVTIRQEKSGQVALYGLHEQTVTSPAEMLDCLNRGSNYRSTSSTLMNSASSRSHAIFTISIEQHTIEDLYTTEKVAPQEGEVQQFMIAKFHFVDLAGSERAKRTGATGQRLKEGININRGLLALGNVISALTQQFGDSPVAGGSRHIPYRDSKLTRILQNSLGGNSRTSMIACISPAQDNFEQTLNTLKYASRARNIKNKPVVNRDPNSQMIAALRGQVYDLSRDVSQMKKLLDEQGVEYQVKGVVLMQAAKGSSPMKSSGGAGGYGRPSPQMEQELREFRQAKQNLEIENGKLQKEVEIQRARADTAQVEILTVQRQRDILKYKYEKLKPKCLDNDGTQSDDDDEQAGALVDEFQKKIEDLRVKLEKSELECAKLIAEQDAMVRTTQRDGKLLEQKSEEIEQLKFQLREVKMRPNAGTGSKGPALRRSTTIGTQRRGSKKFNSGFDDWINSELSSTMQNFNKQFMTSLNASITQIFGGGSTPHEGVSHSTGSLRTLRSKSFQDFAGTIPEENEHQDEDEKKEKEGLEFMKKLEEDEKKNSEQEEQDIDTEALNREMTEQQKAEEDEIQRGIKLQQEGLQMVEHTLEEKEELLKTVQEEHNKIQNHMLDLMKEQYHKKIQEAMNEMMEMEEERARSPHKSGKMEKQFKQRMGELENKIKEFRAKEKESAQLQRVSKEQQRQITTLKDEIQRNKSQRVTLTRKLRDITQEHQKWKAEKGKELLRAKKASVQKDREIQKLRSEKAKKELVARLKTEEVRALQKSRKSERKLKATVTKKSSKDAKDSTPIKRVEIRAWLETTTEKVLNIKEIKDSIDKERSELQMLETELQTAVKQKAAVMLHLERLEYDKENSEEDHTLEAEHEMEDLRSQMRLIEDDIESKEEKVVFKRDTIQGLTEELIQVYKKDPEAADDGFTIPKWLQNMRNFQGQRIFLLTVFDFLLELCYELRENAKNLTRSSREIDMLRDKVKTGQAELSRANEEMHRLRNDFEQRKRALLEISQNGPGTQLKKLSEIRRQYKKETQPRMSTITTTAVGDLGASINIKRASALVSNPDVLLGISPRLRQKESEQKDSDDSYNSLKYNSRKSEKFTPTSDITPKNQSVFSRLAPAAPEVNLKRAAINQVPPLPSVSYPDDNKWHCRGSILDAHPAQVFALANYGNLLFSGSNKSFKVWNLDTLQQISDVEAHPSFIKSVEVWNEHSMLVTACDRTISLWDLLSLQCIGSLKGHSDQIRSLLVKGNRLYSAGKSGKEQGGAALLVWDLRMQNCLLQEREPHQDIFSLASAVNPSGDEQLFAGTRNHSVLRFMTQEGKEFKQLSQLLPQHYDTVQSLALMEKCLISGARDGHLRVWDLWSNPEGPFKMQHCKQAHLDWVTSLKTNVAGNVLYSSCRQGVVKTWRFAKGKLRCRSQFQAHQVSQRQTQQPINDLCSVKSGNHHTDAIVTGSMDRSIKIFKLKKQHSNILDLDISSDYTNVEDSPPPLN